MIPIFHQGSGCCTSFQQFDVLIGHTWHDSSQLHQLLVQEPPDLWELHGSWLVQERVPVFCSQFASVCNHLLANFNKPCTFKKVTQQDLDCLRNLVCMARVSSQTLATKLAKVSQTPLLCILLPKFSIPWLNPCDHRGGHRRAQRSEPPVVGESTIAKPCGFPRCFSHPENIDAFFWDFNMLAISMPCDDWEIFSSRFV